MSIIRIEKINEVHLRFFCEDMGVESEIVDYFTYEYPGAKFTPQYRARLWDGKVRLADPLRKTLYLGLYDYLIKFADTHGHAIEHLNDFGSKENITLEEVKTYANSLKLHGQGSPIDIRDYQLDAIHTGLSNLRNVLLSPTGSGKSLIIYTMCRYHLDRSRRTLLVTPSTGLVLQMQSDFKDYSSHNKWPVDDHLDIIMSGFSKTPCKPKIKIHYTDGTTELFTPNQVVVTANGKKLAKDLKIKDVIS